MPGTQRTLSEPQKKIVAARQQWRCSVCNQLLPATYQVDHTNPLWRGGADHVGNCTAMCPNCHAAKTQQEAIERSVASKGAAATYRDAYDNRTDFFNNGMATCALCGLRRPADQPHERCSAIDLRSVNTHEALQRFAFVPRGQVKEARAAWHNVFN